MVSVSLVGPLSGALIAGGVYYGFSNLIQTRTEQHRKDLHTLSVRLNDASPSISGPSPASKRIVHRQFSSLLKGRWNEEVESVATIVRGFSRRTGEFGRKLLHGGPRQEQS